MLFSEDLKNHTNGFIEETDTQKTIKSEEQQCFHYFEPHLHAGILMAKTSNKPNEVRKSTYLFPKKIAC